MKGLNTEMPEGVELTARCVCILYNLEKNPAVSFETDDSPDHMEDLRTLLKICLNVGYRLLKHNRSKLEEVNVDKQLTSGAWIILNSDRIPKV
jgi:hypothetical protein